MLEEHANQTLKDGMNASSAPNVPFAISCLLGTTVATLATNCGVLAVFLINKSLRTAFNVYIMALLSANIIFAAVDGPLKLLAYPYPDWRLGPAVCTLRIYSVYIIAAMAIHFHLLITLNRVWAMFWPVSYRNSHSTALAWCLCGGTVFYLHVVLLPGILLDAVYYRISVERGCWLDFSRQFAWATFTSWWVFIGPKVFIPICYPFLWRKEMRRRAIIAAGQRFAEMTMTSTPPTPADMTTAPARPQRSRLRPFIVLTLFTISIIVCWMPSLMYYQLLNFVSMDKLKTFGKVADILYSLQGLLDPVFVCLSLSKMYHHVMRLGRVCVSQAEPYKAARQDLCEKLQYNN
ncbi:5-hydroxytryptamine receptor 1A-like [Paramacrobiotus metropolitanus]|uniref:5-hydroxytryptamine receptor 1A-like n=1 Tax=Paramacrobiotus metropolitanus TaxID=2943436 RepID=UPI0024464114|nr:5-hydroxytryptamine receptor 1A-like [Paramacrobiotus metropolitanus]